MIGLMHMEQMVARGLAGEIKVLGENMPQCHLVHPKSHMTWTGTRAAVVGTSDHVLLSKAFYCIIIYIIISAHNITFLRKETIKSIVTFAKQRYLQSKSQMFKLIFFDIYI
jgi:hypothetical protein